MYPNDVRLLSKAFDNMAALARAGKLDLWWDHAHLTKRWRAYNLTPKQRLASLAEFSTLLQPAVPTFARGLDHRQAGHLKNRWHKLLEVLRILEAPSQQTWAGHSPMENRLVSLDDRDARPIKRGKSHPSTELGTTTPMTCNRQGLMITTDHCIGHPNATTLSGPTLERFRKRMQRYPNIAVTDQGFRSAANLELRPKGLDQVFMGRSDDVDEARQDPCRRARSATEGFIALAKHLRGFGRSLYRGLKGARIGTLLNQSVDNLQKCLQLYRKEDLEERTLVTLGL